MAVFSNSAGLFSKTGHSAGLQSVGVSSGPPCTRDQFEDQIPADLTYRSCRQATATEATALEIAALNLSTGQLYPFG